MEKPINYRTHKREYRSWQAMKTRCYNKNDPHYGGYGGRGIKVCSDWQSSFQRFVTDMGERPYGKTLDRIDNNGDYEPSNCRWATQKEQNRNKRNTTKHGKPLVDYAKESGISVSVIWARLNKYGYSLEKAIEKKPVYSSEKGISFDKSRNKWIAYIDYSGKRIQKRFGTEAEALVGLIKIKESYGV